MPKSKNGIPDRWENYSMMGAVLRDTAIMPIKVPLRESLTSKLPPEERFSPSTLLKLFQEKNLKLGGVIDLTFTTRYYDKEFFLQNGVGYKKVFTKGHVVPNNKTYSQFAKAMKELEREGEITCVHCTHGLNRSGYLICRYMIENLNIEPQVAIRSFEEARGHKMERQNYIDDLMTRKCGVITTSNDAIHDSHSWRDNDCRHDDLSLSRGHDSSRHGREDHQRGRGQRFRRQDWNGGNGNEGQRRKERNSISWQNGATTYEMNSDECEQSRNNYGDDKGFRGRQDHQLDQQSKEQNAETESYQDHYGANWQGNKGRQGSRWHSSESQQGSKQHGHDRYQGSRWRSTEGQQGLIWEGSEGHYGAYWQGNDDQQGSSWRGNKGQQGSRWQSNEGYHGSRWQGNEHFRGSRWVNRGPYDQEDGYVGGDSTNMRDGERNSKNNWRAGGGEGGRCERNNNKRWWGSGNEGTSQKSSGNVSGIKPQHIVFD